MLRREALLEAWGACGSAPTRDDATELLSRVPQELPADPSTRALLAAVLLWCGERQRGLALLRGLCWQECDPADAGKAGAALVRLGLVEPALAPLQRALADSDSRNAAAHRINLGRALTLAGRAEEALPHLQQGCSMLGSEHSLARRSLAEAYLALGHTDDALACLPTDSEEPAVVCALAASCRHEEAAALLREAIERLAGDAQPLVLMAAELADVRGRTGEAMALLRQALDADPDNVALWARLAQRAVSAADPPPETRQTRPWSWPRGRNRPCAPPPNAPSPMCLARPVNWRKQKPPGARRWRCSPAACRPFQASAIC